MNQNKPAFKIAVISTAFYLRSHSDVICTRWTHERPYDKECGWDGPSSTLASIFIEQQYDNDTGVAWARDHGVPLYDNVEAALTLGQDKIAVDGVILIGEHGEYPQNEFDQKTYPRKRLFDAIVAVYRKFGRSLPIFVDKHYSYDAKWGHEMVETAQAMGFPLLGGSSIEHTPFVPELTLKRGFKPRQALAVYYGDKEAYLYHSFEFAQSILEKRAGGEAGIAAVTAFSGPEVWDELERRFGNDMLKAALATTNRITPGDMRENCSKAVKQPLPVLTIAHHADGLDVAHLNLHGHLIGWVIAIQTEDGQIHATASTAKGEDVWFAHFATLTKLIETFLMTGKYPYAPQRALFTTCATAAAMYALYHKGKRYESPEAMVTYQPMEKEAYYHPAVVSKRTL